MPGFVGTRRAAGEAVKWPSPPFRSSDEDELGARSGHRGTERLDKVWLYAPLCAGLVAHATAQHDTAPAELHRRTVLALTSTFEPNRNAPRLDFVHELVQMPLNHLGMVVVEHDVAHGPPSVEWPEVRAVLTWFIGNEPPCEWLWPFLEDAVRARGIRVVHLGDFGPLAHDTARLHRWLSQLGLGWDGAVVDDPFRVEVEFSDHARACFEATLLHPRVHRGPWLRGDASSAWVETRDNALPRRPRAPVLTGPFGGIALQPWLLRIGGPAEERRWFVDPFRFLRTALDLDGAPAPDPAVLNGRRMFVLHVDGDGFESASSVVPGQTCAQVFLDRVVDAFRIPMTVSVIVASLTDDLAPPVPTRGMQLAAEILARPHVEAASHSVLHPLDWRKQLTRHSLPRSVTWYPGLLGYSHDMVAEVRESIRFIDEHLLRDGKRCRVMLWSGACNPDIDVLAAARDAGCVNLNGGECRWDRRLASVGFVSPWGKALGDEFQIYCGAANENVFDGFFTTMPGAFAHVGETLENTGRGRILKPANVYVHFYSAENPARLHALLGLIERWAMREPTAPVFASTWAAAVHSAQHGCRIERTAAGWRLSDFGACRTVRFDGEARHVDWRSSRGLLGALRNGGTLFVHLAGPDAEIAWSERAVRHAHVEQADHALEDVVLAPTSVACRSRAPGRRTIVFAGFAPMGRLVLRVGGQRRDVASDALGRVEVVLPEPGDDEVRIAPR